MKTSDIVRPTLLAGSLLLQLSALCFQSLGAAGDVDLSFDPGSGVNGPVTSFALQPDGKALIGGHFTSVKGLARNSVARLNADGSGDGSFNLGVAGGYYGIAAVVLQPDGKVLLGHYGGIARHNSDGSLDTNFNAYLYSDYSVYNATVNAIAVQSDGKVLVGGYLATIGAILNYGIARLNADGSIDTNFNAGSFSGYGENTLIQSIAVQSDGKVLVGGNFSTLNGTNYSFGIARLDANGALDNSFAPGAGADSTVDSVVVQSDGKVLLGGAFSTVNGTKRNGIARLHANGSVDYSFNPGTEANSSVAEVVLQADGKVFIGGNFLAINGTHTNYGIARLNANGSFDSAFDAGPGVNGSVFAIAAQSDGKVLIGGSFIAVNGTNQNHMARLNADGGLDSSFHPGRGLPYPGSNLEVQPDGKVLVSGVRLNPDGSWDHTYVPVPYTNNPNFNPDLSVPGTDSSVAECSLVQADGKVLIGGYTFSEYYDFDGGYYLVYSYFLYRFHPDGSRDLSFQPAIGALFYWEVQTIRKLALQPDGKVLMGGTFGIARLNANGTADSGFIPGFGGSVDSMFLQPDGRVLVGSSAGLAWLNSDGSRDPCFNPTTDNNYSLVIVLQPDGRIFLGGFFSTINGMSRNRIARLNSNGSLDSSFDPGTGANGTITAIAVQPDGNVLIAGNFVTVNGVVRPYVARLFGDLSRPQLRLSSANNNDVTVAWSASSTGFTLQQNTNLGMANWVNVTTAPTTVGLENQVAISPLVGQRFFRLFSNTTNTPPPAPPGPPAPAPQLTAIAGEGIVSLSWTAFPGATGHHVQRATDYSGPFTTLANPGAASYTDTAVVNGTTYYYIVSVIYPCGESGGSYAVGAMPFRTVHVQSITMSWVAQGNRYYTRAVVKVVDGAGVAVSGATVSADFSGSINNAGLTGVTAANGNATITSTSMIRNGTVTFTVANIYTDTMSYNPAANVITSAAISR